MPSAQRRSRLNLLLLVLLGGWLALFCLRGLRSVEFAAVELRYLWRVLLLFAAGAWLCGLLLRRRE